MYVCYCILQCIGIFTYILNISDGEYIRCVYYMNIKSILYNALYDASNALVFYIYIFKMSPSNIQFPSSPLNRMRRSHLDDPNFREEYETESCRLGRHRLH